MSQTKRKSTTKKKKTDELQQSQTAQAIELVVTFLSLLLFLIAVIPAGSVWGAVRSFLFGLFGFGAYVLPLFVGACCVVASLGKATKKFRRHVIEASVLYTILVSFIHVVSVLKGLSYGGGIAWAYHLLETSKAAGKARLGTGVFGALFGGLPLLLTGGSKAPAAILTALLFIVLFLLFTGTTIVRLVEMMKKPAHAVNEYREEKVEDIKETYSTVAENHRERRAAREAEAFEAREREREREREMAPLDIPLDDETIPDMGLDPFLEEKGPLDSVSPEEERPPVPDEPILPEPVETVSEPKRPRKKKTPAEVHLEDAAQDLASEEGDAQPAPDVRPYELPSLDLLNKPVGGVTGDNEAELRAKSEKIVRTLQSFGIGTHIVDISRSPSVTRFELQPDPGVKISRITALADDIAMNLAASGVRIEAPIPNKNAVGIEVPNAEKTTVTLREILESKEFAGSKAKTTVALGRDIQGNSTCADLSKMPHLLVAGTTGSGKSVCLNAMIMSLLYKGTPEEIKLIMIDPKKVEFSVYQAIPHLLVPVVSDPRKAAGALSWAAAEMDKRYALFAEKGVRNIQGYNTIAAGEGLPKMPTIVIFIDELSDLMMVASKEVEDSICRLAQKARAAGMVLVIATQRPSVDVITGLIKANIPSRIALTVKSQIDSRTIIDQGGAEKLLGHGDMLFCPVNLSKPLRVQGCYVDDEEIERVVNFVSKQSGANYDDSVMEEIEKNAAREPGKKKNAVDTELVGDSDEDEMFPKAVEVVVEAGMASTTLLQRKLKLGYARAARIIDELSERGVIGPFEGSKPRKVLITKEQWMEMQANSASDPRQLSVDDLDAPAEEHNYWGSAVSVSDYDVGDE